MKMSCCGIIRRIGMVLLLLIPCVFQLFLAFNNQNGCGILFNCVMNFNNTSSDHTIDHLAVLPQFQSDAVATINDNNSSMNQSLPIPSNDVKISSIINGSSSNSFSQTKIVAICDSLYKEIAPFWYHRLTRLGYDNAVVIAVDKETEDYLQQEGVPYEPLSDSAKDCPKFNVITTTQKGKQQYRRTIFGMRYLYLLHQLERGYHVLLADIDNNFIRYMPMSIMETSEYDVYHAYGETHPTEIFQQLGFTVCGGMAWFRSSPNSIRFVKEILRQCGMNENSLEQCSICDDQRKINNLLLRAYGDSVEQRYNTTKWMIPPHTLDRNVFWKQSIVGQWGVTGHTFKIWDVDTAYRGPLPTADGECPGHERQHNSNENHTNATMNWVAMPTTINRGKNAVQDRKLRLRGWYDRCERDKIHELEGDNKLPIVES